MAGAPDADADAYDDADDADDADDDEDDDDNDCDIFFKSNLKNVIINF
jgi:hypothetical protein